MSTYLHYICRTRIKNGAADSPNAADSTLSIVFHFRARARVRSYRVKLFPLLNILFCFVNQTNKKTHSKTPCVLFFHSIRPLASAYIFRATRSRRHTDSSDQ